ncbi:MAG: hypothetical protein R2854_13280 [Caldilineaceae bacterium]
MPEKQRFSITALILILLVIGALVGINSTWSSPARSWPTCP